MIRLTRDWAVEPVSRDLILRRKRGHGKYIYIFPCLADHEQDWQPYPVDPYYSMCDDNILIHTLIAARSQPPPPLKLLIGTSKGAARISHTLIPYATKKSKRY